MPIIGGRSLLVLCVTAMVPANCAPSFEELVFEVVASFDSLEEFSFDSTFSVATLEFYSD